MPHATPCKECSRIGLPILFTRYAAGYSATAAGDALLDTLRPRGNLQAEPGGVALKTARYGVRMLRAGYLYIRTEAAGIRTPEWLAYAIHPHGYLTAIDIHAPAATRAEPACRPDEWGANKTLAFIGDVGALTKFNFMFHPDPIDYDHLVGMIGTAPDRYMQRFDIAGWARGSTQQKDSCTPAQLDGQVLEFAALDNPGLQDVANEQHFGLMGCTPGERECGSYDDQREGRHFENTAGGAALGPVGGSYLVTVHQPGYTDKHRPRLDGLRARLIEGKGVVLACEDPIGIAQELSMHHLTAAVPYAHWLQQKDAGGVSNQFKQAASASIGTLQNGLAKSALAAYDQVTDATRRAATHVLEPTLGSATYRVTLPDGSVKVMGEAEHNRYLHDQWLKEADMRVGEREKVARAAADKTQALYDGPSRAAFDKAHRSALQTRDEQMDRIAADLQRWLQADALTDTALGRYNPAADPARSRDGIDCAGQLCAMLLQMDSAPRGRQWFAALDTFTPGTKNLVWRMLSLNNAALGAEIAAAMKLALDPLPYGERKAHDVYAEGRRRAAIDKAAAALGMLGGLLKNADAIDAAQKKLNDPLTQGLARYGAYWDIGKAAQANMLSVLLAAALARVKQLPTGAREQHIARTQLLVLAHGMGSQAPAFLQRDMNAAIQGRRVPMALGALSMLAIIPRLGTAGLKHDARSVTEASASIAQGIGTAKGWKASFYETTVFKQVPHLVKGDALPGAMREASKELGRLKGNAARYVVAGTAVGVWWDAVDGVTAYREGDSLLMVAYNARAITGLVAIGTTLAGVSLTNETAALWLSRINIYIAILTGASTYAIGKLQGDAWVNWLLAQPFRLATVKDADKNAFVGKAEDAFNAAVPIVTNALGTYGTAAAGESGVYIPTPKPPAPSIYAIPESQVLKTNTKTPFKSEAQMMSKLADVLSGMK